jgi:DNA-binding LacI/PurR family transcriptional regulator
MAKLPKSGVVRKSRAFEAIVDDVRRQIADRSLVADQYLPPERVLAVKYGVSSRVVREALARLEAAGLIARHQGRGTVVLAQPVASEAVGQRSVAVIFQGRVRDASTADEFDGLQQAFQREGYGTTLYVADGSPEKESQIVAQLAADGVPGLVLFSSHATSDDAHLRAAVQSGMKIVAFDHDFPASGAGFVGIDDCQAARDATGHLIRLGCRELLLVNSARDWTTHELREQGFHEAAEGLDPALPRHVLRIASHTSPVEFVNELRRQLTSFLEGRPRRPLGVLAWWDEVALRAIDCLRDAGWSVPGDARVVGFGNEESGELADVPLTTIEIPRGDIAQLAATALVAQMRNPERPPARLRLKARLIIRESCGTYRRHRKSAAPDRSSSAAEAAAD